MRLGVCISVYRIGKNVPHQGRCVVRTVVCVYENVEESMFFKSVCIGRLSMHDKYIQLYAAVRCVQRSAHCVFCAMRVCQFDTSNKIDIEQSIYYLREKS